MKRYSSGLYARLGFSVAIHSNPDIVLVDEVLSVGDAAFRRRALEALRGLIADGKTVLFISHDMWNVRRLCSEILWMEDGAGARLRRGRRDRRALHERGQPAGARRTRRRRCRAIAAAPARCASRRSSCSTAPARRRASLPAGDTLVVRAHVSRRRSAVERPVFQVAIVDVDTGVVVTTASTRGRATCRRRRRGPRRDRVPLRAPAAAAAAVRAAAVDHRRDQLASYDVVTAGPRFAVTGQGGGVDSLADEQDGLVSLPFDVEPPAGAVDVGDTHERRRVPCFVSVPHGASAGNMLRTGGLLDRAARGRSDAAASCCCRRWRAIRRSCASSQRPRVHVRSICRRTRRRASRRGCWRSCRPATSSRGITESVRIRRAEARANGIIRWLRAEGSDRPRAGRAVHAQRIALRAVAIGWCRIPGMEQLFDRHRRCCWWRRTRA